MKIAAHYDDHLRLDPLLAAHGSLAWELSGAGLEAWCSHHQKPQQVMIPFAMRVIEARRTGRAWTRSHTLAVMAWPGLGDWLPSEAGGTEAAAEAAGPEVPAGIPAAPPGLLAAVASAIISASFFLRAGSSLSVALSTGPMLPAFKAKATRAARAACAHLWDQLAGPFEGCQ